MPSLSELLCTNECGYSPIFCGKSGWSRNQLWNSRNFSSTIVAFSSTLMTSSLNIIFYVMFSYFLLFKLFIFKIIFSAFSNNIFLLFWIIFLCCFTSTLDHFIQVHIFLLITCTALKKLFSYEQPHRARHCRENNWTIAMLVRDWDTRLDVSEKWKKT